MKILGIIPARYASTRFPGKPLAIIDRKPMIQRVYEQASKCTLLHSVYVATDDMRIADAVAAFGGKYVLTSDQHPSGTDRCLEAMQKISESENINYDAVINIQGDEPFIEPEAIETLAKSFEQTEVQIATLAKLITNTEELQNPNAVKVVRDARNYALYFSRSPIPHIRNAAAEEWTSKHRFYKHIGIYGYRNVVLEAITRLPISTLEKAENLEQLRWLENGFRIYVGETELESLSVDTPEDLLNIQKQF